eukprot:gene7528-15414_t
MDNKYVDKNVVNREIMFNNPRGTDCSQDRIDEPQNDTERYKNGPGIDRLSNTNESTKRISCDADDRPSGKGRWDSSDDEEGANLDESPNRDDYGISKRRKTASSTSDPDTPIDDKSITSDVEFEGSRNSMKGEVMSTSVSQPIVDDALITKSESTSSNDDEINPKPEENVQIMQKINRHYSNTALPLPNIPDIKNIVTNHFPLFHGCRSVDSYQRVRYIDQGTYGMVYAAKCKETGKLYALKQVKMGKDVSRRGFPITALRETNILLALHHPNIIQVKEMVVGSSTDKVYMVMEHMDNDLKSCLEQLKQPLPIAEVKQLAYQLLSAVQHMHEHWYIHRDLKTSNILYSNEGKLAVCDFGMARKYGSPLLPYTFEVITLWYRPPELLLGAKMYSTAVDMWSCGCILAELMLQKPLFPGQGEVDQVTKIFKVLGSPTEQIWPGYSKLPLADKMCKPGSMVHKNKLRELFPKTAFTGGIPLSDNGFDLLTRLLAMDPKHRISASDAVNHPWFMENPLPTPPILMPKFKTTHDTSEDKI